MGETSNALYLIFTQIFICSVALPPFLMFWVFLWYHFPFAWRTLFQISFWASLLTMVIPPFLHLRASLFYTYFWRLSSHGELCSNGSFLSVCYEDVLIPSDPCYFHNNFSNLNCCSLLCNVSYCFIFGFHQVDHDVPMAQVSLSFSDLVFLEILKS